MDKMYEHYREYHQRYGDKAYCMQRNGKEFSRVRNLKEFIEKYTPQAGSVLDVGCGDMYLSTLLPQYTWSGLDIENTASGGKATIYDIQLQPYPFADASFDTIMCSEVLEHLWEPRIVHKEAKRLLKPQGTYIISTPNYDHIDYLLTHYRPLIFDPSYTHLFEHIRQFTPETHEKFLIEAGFKVIKITGCDAQYSQFFQEGRQVLAATLTSLGHKNIDIATVDQIIGAMFPLHSHTVMLVAKHA